MLTPVRVIALPFLGDAWAQPGSQAEPDVEIVRLCATGTVRLRVVGKDGTTPSTATTVDGDLSSLDVCLVKIRKDDRGNVTLARTVSVVVVSGGEALVGQQLTEGDVSPGEVFVVGVISATKDTADALYIYVDAGARRA